MHAHAQMEITRLVNRLQTSEQSEAPQAPSASWTSSMRINVSGDPLNRSDPTGLEGFVPWHLEGRERTPAEVEQTGRILASWGAMWVGGVAVGGSPVLATLSGTKVATGGGIGGIVAGVDSAARGNSTGQVLVDTLKGGVSSAATSAAGQLAGPARVPQTIGEASTAFVVGKELGDSNTKAGIAAFVTGLVGFLTNDPNAAANANSLTRSIVNQAVKNETKNEFKSEACKPASRSGSDC